MPVLTTQKYTISRWMLARLAAEEYVRTFWWVFMAIPLSGIVLLIFGQGLMQLVGAMALFWPFTIPARSIIITSKVGKLFREGVTMRLENGTMYFYGAAEKGMKMNLDSVRKALIRNGHIILKTRYAGFVAIPLTALDGQETAFMEAVTAAELD